MAKISRQKIKNMDPSDISNMKSAKLREILRAARSHYKAQAEKFEKHSRTVWSPAYQKMEEFYDLKGEKAVSRMRARDMRNEIFHLRDFFKAQTSTITGSREVAREQDIIIFGKDEKGNPLHRMTKSQRTEFWSAYSEFELLNPTYFQDMQSERVQQYLGQMMLDTARRTKKRFSFSMDMFDELKDRLDNMEEKESWEKRYAEQDPRKLFSGKWHTTDY